MHTSGTRNLTSPWARALGRAAGAAALWLAAAQPALADGRTAVHNLYANAARARINLGVAENAVMVAPSLVRGMYVMTSGQGKFAGYVNEAGTLHGDPLGMRVYSPSGAPPRPMTPQEIDELRAEVMAGIEYDKLVKVSYGDGGGRRMLMFSALDCQYCKMFEQNFSVLGRTNHTTFYVVPSSLRPAGAGGQAVWRGVSQIWCDSNNGEAWKRYWATSELPPQRQCAFDPATAESAGRHLKGILQVVGARIDGVPTLVREDGVLLNPADLKTYLKLPAPPLTMSTQPVWLAAADNYQMQRVDQPTQQPPAQHSNKLHVGDVLKKLIK